MLCMVGLPARGKSYITKMLTRYLQWQGFPVKSFNAGNLRRQMGMGGANADFFTSETAAKTREDLASACMEEAFRWLQEQDSVCVAIFDATNTTKKRRQIIVENCSFHPGITPVFIESICDDEAILNKNYEMKLKNDDYKDVDPAKARADFLERVKAYEARYETVEDDECDARIRYVKLFNVGQKVIMCCCSGYLTSNIGFYLSNIHINPRKIWLMRHSETEAQRRGQLGSVSDLITSSGKRFCREVAKHVHNAILSMKDAGEDEGADAIVLTGTAPVHNATFNGFKVASVSDGVPGAQAAATVGRLPVMSTSLLNEIDGGDCNGMSYEQIRTEYPTIWDDREKDKLNFRYPGAGGESYVDVIHRLGPVIIELERQHHSVLIISHLAVQRCIFGYFLDTEMREIPHLDLEMHTIYELTPGPFGTQVRSINLTVPPSPSSTPMHTHQMPGSLKGRTGKADGHADGTQSALFSFS
jgi:broad specificity phosphatase PhoE